MQTRWLAEKLPATTSAEIALDGGYGNLKFFSGLRGVRVFATARMRNDRVLYQFPRIPKKGQQKRLGRPNKYGPEFRSADLADTE